VRPFGVERWFSRYEFTVGVNIAESCIKPLSLKEIADIAGPAFLEEFEGLTFGYTDGSGDPALRRAVASMYEGATEDNVLVTVGAIEANFLAFNALIQPGDEVISVFPAYQQLYEVPEAAGAVVKRWVLRRENRFAPDLDELRRLITPRTKMIVINFPHNPTGVALSPELLEEICGIACERGILLHSDEVYRGLRLDGGPPSPSAWDYRRGGVVVVGSMSKAFGLSGARIGWIVASPEIIRRCAELRDYVSICPAKAGEVVARAVLENRVKVMERNRWIALENYGILREWLRENEEFVGAVLPFEGVVAFPWLRFPMPSEEFCEGLVREHDVLVVPGSRFETEGHFRVGFGYAREKLIAGLDRLSTYLRKVARGFAAAHQGI